MYALFFIFTKAIFRENVIEKVFVIDFTIEIIFFKRRQRIYEGSLKLPKKRFF